MTPVRAEVADVEREIAPDEETVLRELRRISERLDLIEQRLGRG